MTPPDKRYRKALGLVRGLGPARKHSDAAKILRDATKAARNKPPEVFTRDLEERHLHRWFGSTLDIGMCACKRGVLGLRADRQGGKFLVVLFHDLPDDEFDGSPFAIAHEIAMNRACYPHDGAVPAAAVNALAAEIQLRTDAAQVLHSIGR